MWYQYSAHILRVVCSATAFFLFLLGLWFGAFINSVWFLNRKLKLSLRMSNLHQHLLLDLHWWDDNSPGSKFGNFSNDVLISSYFKFYLGILFDCWLNLKLFKSSWWYEMPSLKDIFVCEYFMSVFGLLAWFCFVKISL